MGEREPTPTRCHMHKATHPMEERTVCSNPPTYHHFLMLSHKHHHCPETETEWHSQLNTQIIAHMFGVGVLQPPETNIRCGK